MCAYSTSSDIATMSCRLSTVGRSTHNVNVTVVIVISILQHRVKITETGEVIDVSDEDIEKVSITV